jgi:hypothetical protein
MLSSTLSSEEVRRLFHQLLTRTSPSNTNDSTFLSIDISHGNKKRFSAIGASLLDTRCLTSSTAPSHHTRVHPLLHKQTFNFRYGPSDARRTQARVERAALLSHVFSHADNDGDGDV